MWWLLCREQNRLVHLSTKPLAIASRLPSDGQVHCMHTCSKIAANCSYLQPYCSLVAVYCMSVRGGSRWPKSCRRCIDCECCRDVSSCFRQTSQLYSLQRLQTKQDINCCSAAVRTITSNSNRSAQTGKRGVQCRYRRDNHLGNFDNCTFLI